MAASTFFDDPAALAVSDQIDLFVELIGGADGPAYVATKAALGRAVPVVTANKAMIARHGLELAALAEKAGVALSFEASSAGGIPIVKTLREAMAGNSVRRVYGILNGTCNYILSRMETDGLSFEECLADAQRLGYAEADPTFDIGGFDTAHKLAILTSLAFGTRIDADAIHIEGIETISLTDLAAADELGYRIKLLGVAERTARGVEQRVHPTMVAKSSAIAQVMGVLNAVTIDGDAVGELTLIGPGAGGEATASAVAADIADIARGIVAPAFGRPVALLEEAERIPVQRHEGGYYIRLSVEDRPGAMAAIATRMGEKKISLEAIMQKGRPAKGARRRAGRADHPCDQRDGDPRGARPGARRRLPDAEAAGHPHRAGIGAPLCRGTGLRRRQCSAELNKRCPTNSPSRTPAGQANRPPPVCVVNWFSASSLAMFSKILMKPLRGSR